MSEKLFDLLDEWVAHRWIRPLDRAFVKFLEEQVPRTHELVLLAAALASHQLGRGHICLDIKALFKDPDACLSLPPEGEQEEDRAMKPSAFLAAFDSSELVRALERSDMVSAGEGDTPLVISEGRLYLRKYWQYAVEIGDAILHKLERKFELPGDFSERLDDFFNPLRDDEEKNKKAVHWQSVGAVIAARGELSIISGGPGTGKTTTVVRLLGVLQEIAKGDKGKLRIHLAAPTGKAAARLTESIERARNELPEDIRDDLPGEVTTLHRLLGSKPGSRHFRHNKSNRLHTDLVVVDEASMIDLEMMASLLNAMPEGARLILLGDKDQLASVEAGSVLGDICLNAHIPSYTRETIDLVRLNSGYDLDGFAGDGKPLDQSIAVLRKSHRFGEKSGIGALARAVNEGCPKRVESLWNAGYGDIARVDLIGPGELDGKFSELIINGNPGGFSSGFNNGTDAEKPSGYKAYLTLVKNGPENRESEDKWLRRVLDFFDRFRILSPLRKGPWGVEGLNERVTEILCGKGLIKATGVWYSGRPVIVTRNDYTLGLMNGDVGILLPVNDPRVGGSTLRVVFPAINGSLKKILPSSLNHVETVYAMTVHKSQGSEFDHTALVLPETMNPVLTRELVYTGITRASRWCTIAGKRLDLLGEAVTRRIRRASGLGDLLRKNTPV